MQVKRMQSACKTQGKRTQNAGKTHANRVQNANLKYPTQEGYEKNELGSETQSDLEKGVENGGTIERYRKQ